MITLKALGFAGVVAFGAVTFMATDREPCDSFTVLPVPDQATNGVTAGNQFVATFHYPTSRLCEMSVIQKTVRWRMVDSAGHMFNFDPDPTKLLMEGTGGNPIGVVARVPADATPGDAKFRISMEITKNPLQEFLRWPISVQPDDVPFKINPPEEQLQQESKNNG